MAAAFVQTVSAQGSSVSSQAVVVPSVAAGNLLIISTKWNDVSNVPGTVTSVTVSGEAAAIGVSAGPAAGTFGAVWPVRTQLAYLLPVANAGTKTITVTLSAVHAILTVRVSEFSGVEALDGHAEAFITADPGAPSVSCAFPGDLGYVSTYITASGVTAGSGWTQDGTLVGAYVGYCFEQYKLNLGGAGSQPMPLGGLPVGGADQSCAAVASFKVTGAVAASGGGNLMLLKVGA